MHAGYLRLPTDTKNMSYLLLFEGNNGYMNVPMWYVAWLVNTTPIAQFPFCGLILT